MQEFSFIIGRKWDDAKPVSFPNIGIYQYFEQVHTGTIEFARSLLEEIQLKNPQYVYKIYPVTIQEAVE